MDRAAESQSLIVALEHAFASVSRGAVTLHEAEVIDDYGTDAERTKARRRDPELDWRDVPDSSIASCLDALSHLDPESWRFYLPAFIRLGLRTMTGPHSPIDRAIYALAVGDDRKLNDYQRARFETLDAAQAEVIRRFLQFATENDDHCDGLVAGQALEKHWRLVR